ncbi:MAG TPA: rhodanese-like domain-containing protein [Cyclobacteriaceae bacterium]
MKHCLFILVVTIAFAGCASKDDKTTSTLTPEAFQSQLQATPDAVLLDVRTLEEVQSGRIKGEVNFDFKAPEFDLLIKGLDKTKPYFVYCASGVRSGKAADQMKEEGFEKVYTLEGGLKAWKAAGLPVQQ